MLQTSFTLTWLTAWPALSYGSCRTNGSPKHWRRKATDSENRIFPPLVILWAWITQALDPDPTCNKALARINASRVAAGLPSLSTDTGGYCKARKRLPEGFFAKLCGRLGRTLSAKAGPDHLYHGRPVKIVDGSGSSMPDTPSNQKEYPQPSSQKPGCGFPAISFVGIFCLATGAIIGIEIGTCSMHDLTLFCFLRNLLETGDILLADRGFCSYAELAIQRMRGVDMVTRMHQTRDVDFRRGRWVGIRDHIVTWKRPAACPKGLRQKDFDQLPPTLEVREIRYRIEVNGFRSDEITLATTLLDADIFRAEELAELYRDRWNVELNFRHIKVSMQMDVLRGKSPEIVRKEIWTHLLAYNLIRSIIWESAISRGVAPDRISIKGTMQQIAAGESLFMSRPAQGQEPRVQILHDWIASQHVPNRPNRVEPRVRKRRPKFYPLMMKPRAELKARLAG